MTKIASARITEGSSSEDAGGEQPPSPELLLRFSQGELDAFESLFRCYQADVHRWIMRIVGDHALSQDLTLEAFWRVYRAHGRFDPHRSFAAWIRRFATNVALDHVKSLHPEEPLSADHAAAGAADPIVQRQQAEAIRRAFARLPARFRLVAHLALVEQCPYAEIAETVGLSENGVKSRVFRAVRLLRTELRGMGIEP